MSSETFTKEELVDFIDNLVKEKINNSMIVPFHAQQRINMTEIIDKLDIDFRHTPSPGLFEFVIKDNSSGYYKVFMVNLNNLTF